MIIGQKELTIRLFLIIFNISVQKRIVRNVGKNILLHL